MWVAFDRIPTSIEVVVEKYQTDVEYFNILVGAFPSQNNNNNNKIFPHQSMLDAHKLP